MCLRGACELNSAMKMKQDLSWEEKKRAKILADSRLFSNTVHCWRAKKEGMRPGNLPEPRRLLNHPASAGRAGFKEKARPFPVRLYFNAARACGGPGG
jgi:hypothetical protein